MFLSLQMMDVPDPDILRILPDIGTGSGQSSCRRKWGGQGVFSGYPVNGLLTNY